MTNQKMGFDLNMWEGSRLALGDQTGSISVFGLNSPGSSGSVGEGRAEAEADDVKYPDLVFDAHTGKRTIKLLLLLLRVIDDIDTL